jgi:DNA-binding LacI/PurR family transcriptional regulator
VDPASLDPAVSRAMHGSRRRKEAIGLICVQCPGQPQDVENNNSVYNDEVDGVLSSIGSFPSWLLEWMVTRAPVAVIAGDPAEREVDVVAADNRSGSAAIVTHLVRDHGKRRIYHVDGPPGMPDIAQRRSGLLQVLCGYPAAQLAGTTLGSNYAESGLAAGHRILAECRGDLPDSSASRENHSEG